MNRNFLKDHGIAIKVLGDMTLIPQDVQQVLSTIVLESRLHNKYVYRYHFNIINQSSNKNKNNSNIKRKYLLSITD